MAKNDVAQEWLDAAKPYQERAAEARVAEASEATKGVSNSVLESVGDLTEQLTSSLENVGDAISNVSQAATPETEKAFSSAPEETPVFGESPLLDLDFDLDPQTNPAIEGKIAFFEQQHQESGLKGIQQRAGFVPELQIQVVDAKEFLDQNKDTQDAKFGAMLVNFSGFVKENQDYLIAVDSMEAAYENYAAAVSLEGFTSKNSAEEMFDAIASAQRDYESSLEAIISMETKALENNVPFHENAEFLATTIEAGQEKAKESREMLAAAKKESDKELENQALVAEAEAEAKKAKDALEETQAEIAKAEAELAQAKEEEAQTQKELAESEAEIKAAEEAKAAATEAWGENGEKFDEAVEGYKAELAEQEAPKEEPFMGPVDTRTPAEIAAASEIAANDTAFMGPVDTRTPAEIAAAADVLGTNDELVNKDSEKVNREALAQEWIAAAQPYKDRANEVLASAKASPKEESFMGPVQNVGPENISAEERAGIELAAQTAAKGEAAEASTDAPRKSPYIRLPLGKSANHEVIAAANEESKRMREENDPFKDQPDVKPEVLAEAKEAVTKEPIKIAVEASEKVEPASPKPAKRNAQAGEFDWGNVQYGGSLVMLKKGTSFENQTTYWQGTLMDVGIDLPKYGKDGDFGSETRGGTKVLQSAFADAFPDLNIKNDGKVYIQSYAAASALKETGTKLVNGEIPESAKEAVREVYEESARIGVGIALLEKGSDAKLADSGIAAEEIAAVQNASKAIG